jgi:hypothetical protein
MPGFFTFTLEVQCDKCYDTYHYSAGDYKIEESCVTVRVQTGRFAEWVMSKDAVICPECNNNVKED